MAEVSAEDHILANKLWREAGEERPDYGAVLYAIAAAREEGLKSALRKFLADPEFMLLRKSTHAALCDEFREAGRREERERWQPARCRDEWHEDLGDVLWWFFPMTESPYVGNPLCSDWPGYHTHFTPLPSLPEPPDA